MHFNTISLSLFVIQRLIYYFKVCEFDQLFKIIIKIGIKMLCLIKRASYLTRTLINNKNVFSFSKEAKPAKGDKGGAPAAPAVPVITQPTLEQLVKKWIKPNHKALSPSEIKMLNEGFEDLSASDKQILDQFALKLLDLPTAVFYDVMKKGALGTSDLYYTSVEQTADVELPKTVKVLRKEV